MTDSIRRAIAASPADDTDVRIERRSLHRVLFRRESLATVEAATERG